MTRINSCSYCICPPRFNTAGVRRKVDQNAGKMIDLGGVCHPSIRLRENSVESLSLDKIKLICKVRLKTSLDLGLSCTADRAIIQPLTSVLIIGKMPPIPCLYLTDMDPSRSLRHVADNSLLSLVLYITHMPGSSHGRCQIPNVRIRDSIEYKELHRTLQWNI